MACERPPRPLQLRWLRDIFLCVASTPPHEEGNARTLTPLEVDAGVDQDRPRRGLGGSTSRVRGSRRWRTDTARDTSERRGVDIHVRIAPLRVVQSVDQIGPKSERHVFTNLRSLANPHIHQEMARTCQVTQAQCAHIPWPRIRQYRPA